MAEKTLNTRIQLKYDTYSNWYDHNPVLKKGEMAIVEVPTNATKKDATGKVVPQQPAILFKIGDGSSNFRALDWAAAKAADVHDWAKAETLEATAINGLGTYIADYVDEELGISVDTDTQYTIEAVSGNAYQYKLKSKGKGDSTFSTEVATITIPKNVP